MRRKQVEKLFDEFSAKINSDALHKTWTEQSDRFKSFFENRVLAGDDEPIPDEECDVIVRILDTSGKGNTKESEAVARTMVPQGAWRRIFNEFHSNHELARLVLSVLKEPHPSEKAALIDKLYDYNEGQKNNLTGPSGNTIGAFLAAYDPFSNLAMISLNDRKALLEYLNSDLQYDWDDSSIGKKIVETAALVQSELKIVGVTGSAIVLTRFCYFEPFRSLWKVKSTVKRPGKTVSVSVPEREEPEHYASIETDESLRESMQIQAEIAKIGAAMGFKIWLPRADKSRVLRAWTAKPGELLDDLPLGYDPATMKTIEQIDVLWINNRTIVRAFEVEHTTSIYSGLLRMADLLALQPNIDIKLHIVGFYPDFTDTSKKPHNRQKECLCRREESSALSSNRVL